MQFQSIFSVVGNLGFKYIHAGRVGRRQNTVSWGTKDIIQWGTCLIVYIAWHTPYPTHQFKVICPPDFTPTVEPPPPSPYPCSGEVPRTAARSRWPPPDEVLDPRPPRHRPTARSRCGSQGPPPGHQLEDYNWLLSVSQDREYYHMYGTNMSIQNRA